MSQISEETLKKSRFYYVIEAGLEHLVALTV